MRPKVGYNPPKIGRQQFRPDDTGLRTWEAAAGPASSPCARRNNGNKAKMSVKSKLYDFGAKVVDIIGPITSGLKIAGVIGVAIIISA
jgi:hypothetical protein